MSARHHRHFQRLLRGVPRESALALAGIGECGRHASRLQVHVRGTLARGLPLQLVAEVVISSALIDNGVYQGWGGSEIHDLSSLQILPILGSGTELSSNFSETPLTGTELKEL